MLDKLLGVAVKKYGLDKYVLNVSLTKSNQGFHVSVGDATKSVAVYLDVVEEYRDEVELFLGLLGK